MRESISQLQGLHRINILETEVRQSHIDRTRQLAVHSRTARLVEGGFEIRLHDFLRLKTNKNKEPDVLFLPDSHRRRARSEKLRHQMLNLIDE